MLIISVTALFGLLLVVVFALAGVASDDAERYAAQLRVAVIQQMAEDFEYHYEAKRAFPASLDAFDIPGLWESQPDNLRWMGYEIAWGVEDNGDVFDRVVAYSINPRNYPGLPDVGSSVAEGYLQRNTCGDEGFHEAGAWCGELASTWYRFESRRHRGRQSMEAAFDLMQIISKIGRHFVVTREIPFSQGTNRRVADEVISGVQAHSCNDSQMISASIANLNGLMLQCQDVFGRFAIEGVNIDHAVMYDFDGEILVIRVPFADSSGIEPLTYAIDFEGGRLHLTPGDPGHRD